MTEPSIRFGFTAIVERTHDDRVARLKSGDGFTQLFDGAGHFVADHLGHANAPVHVAVKNMQVCATDAAIGDLEANFAGCGLLRLTSVDRKRAIADVTCCVHAVFSRSELRGIP